MTTVKSTFYYGYVIVMASFLLMVFLLGSQGSFGVFFKPILEDFNWSRVVTSGAFSVSTFAGGVAGIFLGGLNDRFGPRLVMTICAVLTVAGYLLMYFTQSVWELYLFFGVCIGIGSACYAPLLSTIARWFIRRRSTMSGLVFAGSGAGMLIWPIVFDRFIAIFDWRMASLVVGVIMLLGVAVAQIMKRDPAQMGLSAYGAGPAEGRSAAASGSFSLREAMQTPQYWMFCGVLVCYGFIFFAFIVHIVPHITDLNFSASSGANVLSASGAAAIVGQIGLGPTGDRIGYKRAFIIGIVMLALGSLALVFGKQLWAFYLVAILIGLAFGNCSTQESPIAAWLFGLTSHGLILGTFAFSFTVGASIGPLVLGYFFDHTGSYFIGFLVCTVLAVLAVVLTVLVRPTRISLK